MQERQDSQSSQAFVTAFKALEKDGENARSLFAVDDSHIKQMFGAIKDDMRAQSTKFHNMQQEVQSIYSAAQETEYQVKKCNTNVSSLETKLAKVSKQVEINQFKGVEFQKMIHRFFDDMNDLEEKQKAMNNQIVKKQTKIMTKAIKLKQRSQASLDSLKEEEESLESKPSQATLEKAEKEESKEKAPEKEEVKSPGKITISSPPVKAQGSFRGLQDLQQMEQEAKAEITPLLDKKTSLVQARADQQKFMDEQFQKNAELMEKNLELEERIIEIERLLQAKEEETKELVIDQNEADELPAQPSEHEKTTESIAGKSSRLGHIERRLEYLETNGPRSKQQLEPLDGGKSLQEEIKNNLEKQASASKKQALHQDSRDERSRSMLESLREKAESALDMEENKLQITAVSANFTKLEELVNKIDARVKIMADKQSSLSLDFTDIQMQQTKLEKKAGKHEGRIEALEEQNDNFDLDSIEGKESISAKEIVELMKSFQADMMNKFLTESSLTELKETNAIIEQRIDQQTIHIKSILDMRDQMTEFINLPRQHQDLNLTVTKIENSLTELQRQANDTTRELEHLEDIHKRSEAVTNEMLEKQETGELNFQDLLNVLNKNLEELQVQMVHKDAFLDFKNEQGILIHDLNRLKSWRESAETQIVDVHYGSKKQAHDIQDNQHNFEQLKQEVQEIQKVLKFKVDGEVMDGEMKQAQQRVNEQMEQVVKMVQSNSKDNLTSMPKLPAARFGKALMGGMGIQDKQKLKEISEVQERVQGNQKRIMEQLRNLNIDSVKQQVADLELKSAKRSDIEDVMKKVLENAQIIQKSSKTITDVEKNAAEQQRQVQRTMEKNSERIRTNEEVLEKLEEEVGKLNESILKTKMKSAVANSMRQKLEQEAEKANSANQGGLVDEEHMNELSDAIQDCQDALKEIKTKVQQLQNNTMSKEAIGKIKDGLADKIQKVSDEVDQNLDGIRQHVGGLENALKEASFGMSGDISPSRSRSVPKNRGRGGSNERNKKFNAESFTKDLKTGRLPFRQNGDRIARYGKGFSNLLHMAGTPGYGDNFPVSNSVSQGQEYSQMTVNENRFEHIADPDSISVNMQGAAEETPANKAAFALYRPEPPNQTKIPLDSQTAVRKYRMEQPNMQLNDHGEKRLRNFTHDIGFRTKQPQTRPGNMRGRSYGQQNGIVGYLGTGEGSRPQKAKNNFVHGTGYQNATMHTQNQSRRNHVNSLQTSSTGIQSHKNSGYHQLNVDMNMQEDPRAVLPIIDRNQNNTSQPHPSIGNIQSSQQTMNSGRM